MELQAQSTMPLDMRSGLQSALTKARTVAPALDAGADLDASWTMREVGRSVIDVVTAGANLPATEAARLIDAATGTIAAGGALHNAANGVGYLALQADIGRPAPEAVGEFATQRARAAADDARRSIGELAGHISSVLGVNPST